MDSSIVLAEDEDDLRSIYSGALRHAGYCVREAADGREALELVRSRRPALLILDVWMPVVNGFEVLDRLREDPGASDMKVVMLSNQADGDTRLEGYATGIYDYWVKDLSLTELLERVRCVLSQAGVMPDAE